MVEIEEVNEAPAGENLADLSVTRIKKLMKERGVDASGCTEKEELIKRLEAAPKRALAASSAAAPAAADEEAPDPMAQLGQLGRQLVMLPVLWGSNKVDWEAPANLLCLQVFFGVVVVVAVALLQLTLSKIAVSKDTGRVENPGTSQHFTKAEDGTVSAMEYDNAKVKETRGQLLMGGTICVGMHLKFGYIQPLLMTGIMNCFTLYDCKALHAHLLGAKIERPWTNPAANPLQQWADKKKEEAEAAREASERETAKKSK